MSCRSYSIRSDSCRTSKSRCSHPNPIESRCSCRPFIQTSSPPPLPDFALCLCPATANARSSTRRRNGRFSGAAQRPDSLLRWRINKAHSPRRAGRMKPSFCVYRSRWTGTTVIIISRREPSASGRSYTAGFPPWVSSATWHCDQWQASPQGIFRMHLPGPSHGPPAQRL
jgi:hypothetical protein